MKPRGRPVILLGLAVALVSMTLAAPAAQGVAFFKFWTGLAHVDALPPASCRLTPGDTWLSDGGGQYHRFANLSTATEISFWGGYDLNAAQGYSASWSLTTYHNDVWQAGPLTASTNGVLNGTQETQRYAESPYLTPTWKAVIDIWGGTWDGQTTCYAEFSFSVYQA